MILNCNYFTYKIKTAYIFALNRSVYGLLRYLFMNKFNFIRFKRDRILFYDSPPIRIRERFSGLRVLTTHNNVLYWAMDGCNVTELTLWCMVDDNESIDEIWNHEVQLYTISYSFRYGVMAHRMPCSRRIIFTMGDSAR